MQELASAVTGSRPLSLRPPLVASSGAGCEAHFLEVFTSTGAESALAAGIFHRREVPINAVKTYLKDKVEIRPLGGDMVQAVSVS